MEWYIKVGDNTSPVKSIDNACYKNGDPVDVRPDGSKWSEGEKKQVVKTSPEEDAKLRSSLGAKDNQELADLITSAEVEIDPVTEKKTILRRRQFHIDVDPKSLAGDYKAITESNIKTKAPVAVG